MHRHLLAIDASAFHKRAFHSPAAGSLDSLPLQAAKMLERRIRRWEATLLLMVYDHPLPCVRYDRFPDYKLQRRIESSQPTPAMLNEFMRPFYATWKIPVVEASEWVIRDGIRVERGFEADDYLGSLARLCTERGTKLSIMTRDRDLLALVSDTIRVLWPTGDGDEAVADADWVCSYTGVWPHQVADWKLLSGDDSDGIPNVGSAKECTDGKIRRYGFTPERAAELLRLHGTYEGVYQKKALLARKEYDWLMACADQVEQMRTIIKLRTDIPRESLNLNPESARVSRFRLPRNENELHLMTKAA